VGVVDGDLELSPMVCWNLEYDKDNHGKVEEKLSDLTLKCLT
jgi:hypothetical protein